MKLEDEHSRPIAQEHKKAPAKRSYKKPEVRHESVFEVMALNCGKMASTQGECRSLRKTS
jgi:hypothetical protein